MSEIRFRTISIAEAKRWAQDVDHFTDDEFSLQVEHWKKHELDLPDPSISYGISLDGVPGESMMELVHCVDGEVE